MAAIVLIALCIAGYFVVGAILLPDALAARERRSTVEARVFRFPPGWLRGAFCIHRHESVDWRWSPWRHPGQTSWNGYWGGYQFVLSTWQSTFTPGEARRYPLFYTRPDLAPIREQTYRAFVNWRRNGGRWGGSQWPTSSRACGVA